MIINTNMAALNTYRQLSINEKNTQSSLAKLSSGLRINTAADDAAGLAISEKMRGQISGLNQASSNAQNGISLVSTAEGALNETTSILQRMRELAVNASNDTATDSDRQAMQQEVGQLKDEIDRIAGTTQFNTKNLLDGSLAGAKVAQGTKVNSVSTTIGATATAGAAVSFDSFSLSSDMTLDIKVGATAQTITIAKGNYTADDLGAAIESAAEAVGVHAGGTVTFASGKLTVTNGAGATVGTDDLTILKGTAGGPTLNDIISNGSAADIKSGTASDTDANFNALEVKAGSNTLAITTGAGATGTITVAANVYNGAQLAQAINTAISDNAQLKGNAIATFDTTSNKLTIASTDSSSISVAGSTTATDLTRTTGYTSDANALTATDTTTALLTNLEDSNKNSFGLAVGDVITVAGNINGSAITPKTLTITQTSTIADLAQTVASALNLASSSVTIDPAKGIINVHGQDGTAYAISDLKISAADSDGNVKSLFNNNFSSFSETQAAQDTHTDASLTFQIGANEGQTMKVDINKMDTEALALASVDVSTQQGAETATSVIDNAINHVSTERAKLGAFQNRLEHTINNLGTASQNITSAEANIRDVDMAQEMTNFQKNNILQQAAQAMLAQANQQPQGVLQLLR